MTAIPASLALTAIQPSAQILSADHRNNYAAIQTAVNGLENCLSGGTVGQVVTALSSSAVDLEYPPGHEYAYQEYVSAVPSTATSAATAVQIVSAGAFTFDGATPVWVEFFCPYLTHTVSGTVVVAELYDGSTDLMGLGDIAAPGAGLGQFMRVARRMTPSAASHTFSARVWSGAAGTATANATAGSAGNLPPGWIRITRA